MIIKSKLTEKDFINANFVLLYSNTYMKIFTGILFTGLIVSVLTAILIPEVSFLRGIGHIVILLVMLSSRPLLQYFTAKEKYVSNQSISETIEYRFDKENLLIKGESFNSQLAWDKVYKVTQTKNWIFIWRNKQTAKLIPKRDVGKEQTEELKKVVQEHRIKNNL